MQVYVLVLCDIVMKLKFWVIRVRVWAEWFYMEMLKVHALVFVTPHQNETQGATRDFQGIWLLQTQTSNWIYMM